MQGLTGFSDMRDILKAIAEGDKEAELAYQLYAYRVKKYIGAYAAVLNGLDAIVFTAGVGENDGYARQLICADMSYLGIEMDQKENSKRVKGIREINTETSRVKVLIVPTNEELEIGKQCFALLNQEIMVGY